MRLLRIIAVLALVLAVGGCHALLIAGAGGEAVYIGYEQFNQEADLALAVVKPLNIALCSVEIANPHKPEVLAAITAFCAHLPSDVPGILTQAAYVVAAINTEKATAARDSEGP